MAAILIDVVEVQKLKQQIQAACISQQEHLAKAKDWEQELQAALVPLCDKQKALKMLKSECSALKEKRMAMDEELAERKGKEKSMAKNLAESAERFRKEISSKIEWEQTARDACRMLRIEEHRLQSLASSLEKALTEAIDTYRKEVASESSHALRWRKKPSMMQLTQTQKDSASAELEANKAAAALADAIRRQEAFKQADAWQERSLKQATLRHDDELRSLEECYSDQIASNVNILDRSKSWRILCNVYEKRSEGDRSLELKIKRELQDDRPGHGLVAAAVRRTDATEDRLDSLIEELDCAKRWRRLASVSPVLAAWLVSAWCLYFVHQ